MKKLEIKNTILRYGFEQGEMAQKDLAVRVGVSRQTIKTLEAGKYVPWLGLAFRIARVF